MNSVKHCCTNIRYAAGRSQLPAIRSSYLFRLGRYIGQALAILLLGMTAAHADCTWKNGAGPHVYTFPIPTLTIPRNAAVGTVIYTAPPQATIPATGTYANCTGGSVWAYNVVGATPVIANPPTYATNVPGIGVRYKIDGGYFGPTNTGTWDGDWGFNNTTFGAELVVTGPVGNGTLDSSVIGTMTLGLLTAATLKMTVSSVVASSCSATSSSVAVTLPQAYSGRLSTTGATTGATPFNLALDCSPGTKVNVTLTDASNASNTSTTLSLAPGSTATGIGLQVLNGSTPIAYGPDSAAAGNQNQWLAGTATGGPMTIPLTAQYVRTPGTVAPGTVKGLATFTMSYQ
ncbi:Pilin (type 1 fimbria component protein) [Burkholderia sp. OK233]|nr:Pilin (type 1 fimbria component protein) [Burkholderia sp. OK233]